MNTKALIKTITPTKNGILMLLGVGVFVLALAAIATGITVGIWYGLVFFLGEQGANVASTCLIVAFWVWILIGSPLYDRYQNIKWTMENE